MFFKLKCLLPLFICLVDFPRLFCRRSDADLRFCQLNAFTGEAIMDVHHDNLPPEILKRRFINALCIYTKYACPIVMEAESGMMLLENHMMYQCIPLKSANELSTHDIENIFWLLNEYKRAGNMNISLRRLYMFIHEMQNIKIVRLSFGLSWAKITPVIIRAMVLATRDHDAYVKNSLRRVLIQMEDNMNNNREQEI